MITVKNHIISIKMFFVSFVPMVQIKLWEEEFNFFLGCGLAIGSMTGVPGVSQTKLTSDGVGMRISGCEDLGWTHH